MPIVDDRGTRVVANTNQAPTIAENQQSKTMPKPRTTTFASTMLRSWMEKNVNNWQKRIKQTSKNLNVRKNCSRVIINVYKLVDMFWRVHFRKCFSAGNFFQTTERFFNKI